VGKRARIGRPRAGGIPGKGAVGIGKGTTRDGGIPGKGGVGIGKGTTRVGGIPGKGAVGIGKGTTGGGGIPGEGTTRGGGMSAWYEIATLTMLISFISSCVYSASEQLLRSSSIVLSIDVIDQFSVLSPPRGVLWPGWCTCTHVYGWTQPMAAENGAHWNMTFE